MTRKDYQLIARACVKARQRIETALNNVGQPDESFGAAIGIVEQELSFALASDNPRFDRTRFLQACRAS